MLHYPGAGTRFMLQKIKDPASAREVRNQTSDVPAKLRTTARYRFADDPDAALVSSFRAGNALAFDHLVKRHERRLVNVALRITKNREDAEDVVQDSFLNVFKHLDSFRGASRFLSWLTRITINQALMTIRTKPRKTTSLDELAENNGGVAPCKLKNGGCTPEQLCSQREFERLVFEWTAGMKEDFRQVLELHTVEDLTDEEIAHVLGVSLSAAKSRLFRARRELRKRMEKHMHSANASRTTQSRTTQICKRPSADTPITNRRRYDRGQFSVSLPGSLYANDAFTQAAANAG